MLQRTGIYGVFVLLLLIESVQICNGVCHSMISYGDTNGSPLQHRWTLTGDIHERYNVWQTEDKVLYMFAFYDALYDDWLWIIDDQISGGNWIAFTLLLTDSPLGSSDFAFWDHQRDIFLFNFKFTCEDDVINSKEGLLLVNGYCEDFIMTNYVFQIETFVYHISDCLRHCHETPSCSGFTFTDHSCIPHSTSGCVKPAENDPGFGSRHYTWSYVGIGEGLGTAYQSSVGWGGEAIKALDRGFGGDYFSQLSCTSTLTEKHPWWAVDLKYSHMVEGVVLKVRSDCCSHNLDGVVIGLGTGNLTEQLQTFHSGQFDSFYPCTTVSYNFENDMRQWLVCDDGEHLADYIVLYQPADKRTFLSFCELEVIASPAEKYILIEKRVTHDDGDSTCSSKLSGKGQLARPKTKEEFDLMAEEFSKERIEIAWTGLSDTDSLYKEFWFPNVTNRRLMNVYTHFGAKCASTAVTANYNCNLAFDGITDYESSWIFEGTYSTAWLKIELRYAYTLHAINLMQRFCSCSSIKDIQLTYSDLTTQKLKQRDGTSESDSSGQAWDVLPLNGVLTKTIVLAIQSVYNTYTTQGGIIEMQVIGQDYGVDLRSGLCEGHDLETIYGDVVYCYVTCRNTENCQSLTYHYRGSEFTTCRLKSAICTENEMTVNDNVFTLDLKGNEGAFTLRYGKDERCQLKSFTSTSIEQCINMSDSMVGAVGFSMASLTYDLCTITCSKDSTGHLATDTSISIFFERLGESSNTPDVLPSTLGSYVGCYHEWALSQDSYTSTYTITDITSNLASDCITSCRIIGFKYAALQVSDCVCRMALGQQTDGCTKVCNGDPDNVEICGEQKEQGGLTAWTVYTTEPQLPTECIQLSTKPLETAINHHPWMADTGLSKTQKNFCDTEYPLMCENMEFNFCARTPCENSGTCQASTTDYLCHCVEGFTGVHCESDVDECTSDVCSNGALCRNTVGSFSCVCLEGYAGDTCQIDINECENQSCMNHGICVDQVNFYICDCDPGYTGQQCETDINECLSRPCWHGSVCEQAVDSFSCLCMAGYEGLLCEREVDECSSQPCLNGGSCTDLLNKYLCVCVRGYSGDSCQTDINECSSSPCQNGATCLDLLDQFECRCVVGFDGIYCENNINECWSGPCQNNAPCLDLVDSYKCECLAGFGGDTCAYYIGNPGDWSEWGAWGQCSTSCDQGVAYRSRDCIPQFPQLGGGICAGSDSDSITCMQESCGPVDGAWSPWSPTSSCGPVCGAGLVAATRNCNAPQPANGGAHCAGDNTTVLLCQNRLCHSGQICSEWSTWSDCAGSCSLAHRIRQRSCHSEDEGEEFPVEEQQTQSCELKNCASTGWECSVCSAIKPPESVNDANCDESQQCADDTNACSTSFEILDGKLKLTKGCIKLSECLSLSAADSYCKRLAALGIMTGQSVNGSDVHAVVLTDVLRVWLSLQGDCSICCNYPNCNAQIIPQWQSIFMDNN